MDKSRDIRRGGASRFLPAKRQINKQSGLDDGGGDVVFSEKSKKERLRRLSIVGRVSTSNADSEMGCVGSDGEEDELHPSTSVSRRPRKFFDDCNTVDHASVPRKLRSAMKKRNHKSISPPLADLKQLNHATSGVELPRKNGLKKSKLNQQGDSEAIAGPITKDEEEVVETLYALVGMFTNNDKTSKTDLDGELSEAKSSALPEGESFMPAFEDSEVPKKEEDSKTICPSTTSNPISDSEGLGQATVEIKSLNEVSQTVLPNCNQLQTELDNSFPQVNLPTSLLSKNEPCNEKLSCNYASFDVPSVLSLSCGRSNQPEHEETPPCETKPDISLESAAAVHSQHELQHTINESNRNGLSSTRSHDAGTRGPPLQLSTAKLPAWLGNACATRAGTVENVVLTERHSRIPISRRKSWKRCSTHVYISNVIEVLQIAERKDRLPMQATPLTPNEGSKQGVLTAANNLNGVRNSLNGVVSATSIVGAAAEKNPNAVLSHKRLLQDQQQASTKSEIYSLHKQSFDFLSLSIGDGGWAQADNSKNRAGNGLEPLTQFHVPYLQSVAQNHTAMPSSLPQSCYSSTPFTDCLSAAAAPQVQVQLPPYLGSPFYGPTHLGTTDSAEQQQQQQQQIWATQLAAQYKPGGVTAPHIPNWQNGRRDSPSLIQYAQAILPPSRSSLEVLGPKYTPMSQHQQQQHIAITSSFPPARLKRQHHHFPSGYEGNGVGFHPDSALSLQLLCNEHL
ncbi:hypothetical protein F0562_036100 [Nyssa sinensis]|uniref:Uncharacterized protein n=1 Tax=Nyssa sinensis TaxID=561372 RepID=A0A5J5ACM6_9ASTE|nr:hypothetical protein F0562_036100 [Nyssa sinensis]